MAGPILDIYGNYQNQLNNYWQLADIYNAAGKQYNEDIDTWNAWVNSGAQGTAPMERPTETFDMERPTAPIEPMGNPPSTVFGNINPTELYQSLFGKSTPDILSNEAWSLQNIGTPFLSTETSAYETGNINRMNNPMYYAQPDLLTSGQGGVDINSGISGQQTGNLYY